MFMEKASDRAAGSTENASCRFCWSSDEKSCIRSVSASRIASPAASIICPAA